MSLPKKLVNSVSFYLDVIRAGTKAADSIFAFRGQSKWDWDLLPRLFRPEFKNVLASERELIRDALSLHPEEFENDASMFERLARMQHYGIPTRLLDLTANPLTALYFAVRDPTYDSEHASVHIVVSSKTRRKFFDSDALSCITNLCNLSADERQELASLSYTDRSAFNAASISDRLVQFIKSEKPYFRPEIDPVDLYRTCFVMPRLKNRRLIAQEGRFVVFGLDSHASSPSYDRSIKLKKLVIDAKAKKTIRNELLTLGVNEASLFPEIESAAGFLISRYR
ncbi:MAG: FRG domain-containing protein [Caulobacteraceae bacterium]|nr:FRG domain-containing protein [Caulobacter sp.]